MAIIQTVRSVRDRLGYGNTDLVNNAIEAALGSAAVALENSIRTGLARATVDDIFFVINTFDFGSTQTRRISAATPRVFLPVGVMSAELLLTRGFVDSGQTITVTVANSMRNLLGTGEGQSFNILSPKDYTLLNDQKGLMGIYEYDISQTYVRVQYTAGFVTDGGCPEVYVTTALENWLVEASALKTTLLLNGNPAVRREALDEEEIKTIKAQLDNILTSKSRYAPASWKPERGVVTLA